MTAIYHPLEWRRTVGVCYIYSFMIINDVRTCDKRSTDAMRPPHNSTYKGKRVYVQLKDGTEFVDKFLDKKGHYCSFEERGKVRRGDIKVFTIYKNRMT
jgi:hypothetical protein